MAVQKCPTAVQTATVVHTNGHNIIVTISSETAANPVHISYRISYVFLLCQLHLQWLKSMRFSVDVTDGSMQLQVTLTTCNFCNYKNAWWLCSLQDEEY